MWMWYIKLQFVTFGSCLATEYLYSPGVLLTVPEGAIKKGHVEELYMAVCRDDKDRPKLTGKSLFLLTFIYLLFIYLLGGGDTFF